MRTNDSARRRRMRNSAAAAGPPARPGAGAARGAGTRAGLDRGVRVHAGDGAVGLRRPLQGLVFPYVERLP